ncbi:hypothetical protein H5410_045470 [Solanum commersonii]|uniref:Uncharacterized protein n=1 Tax=Solanum commersonii TaxID=4109 RepID=A0A9J5XCU5_SOLCO|nr:hypothetical protein H5410_045470 [Solanum commersonii]
MRDGVLKARRLGDWGWVGGSRGTAPRGLMGGLGWSAFELVVEGPLPASIPEGAQGRGLQEWRPPIPEALKALWHGA